MMKISILNLTYIKTWLIKNTFAHSWIVFVYPSLSQILVDNTKMILRGIMTEIKIIEFVSAFIDWSW